MSWGRSRSVGFAESIWTGFLLLLSLTQAVVARSHSVASAASFAQHPLGGIAMSCARIRYQLR
jgi:hypothetical protein